MAISDERFVEGFNARVSPTGKLFKARILEVDQAAGKVRLSFDIGADLCNPRGTVQGGIVAALLDEAAAHAGLIMLGERGFIATHEMKVSYFAPAHTGTLLVEARCLKMGRTTCFLEADLLAPDGKLLARMTQTAAALRSSAEPVLVENSS